MLPIHGSSLGENKPKINANFLSMNPSDMFKMMSALGAQNKPDKKPPPASVLPPWKTPKPGLSPEPEDSLGAAAATTHRKQLEVAKTAGAAPSRSSVTQKEAEHCVGYNFTLPRTKSDSKENHKSDPFAKLMQITPQKDASKSNEISYRPPISSSGLKLKLSMKATPQALQDKMEAPILDLDIALAAGSYLNPMASIIQDKRPSGPEFQDNNLPDTEILILTPQQKPVVSENSKKDVMTNLFGMMEPKFEAVMLSYKSPMPPPKGNPGSGPGINLCTPLRSKGPVKGGAGYSFVTGSRFPAVTKADSKDNSAGGVFFEDTASGSFYEAHHNLGCNLSVKGPLRVKQLASSLIQSGKIPDINGNFQPKGHSNIKEKLIAPTLPAASKVKAEDILKLKSITDQILPNLPTFRSGESDHGCSSEDEDKDEEKGREAQEIRKLDDITLVSHKPYTKRITARRRMRQGEFSKWFEEKTKEIHVETVIERHQQDEEKMSARAMITSHNYIISDPREYQMELFEIAKQRNTIAVLDTGSGKTLIACLLIRYMVDQELESRMHGHRRRVSFFLVDCVTLVFQQAAVLNCNIDAKIGKYCGDMGVDLWKKEIWENILDDEQVIVMTADVLYNCLTHAFINIKDINLLCFDEAHHAKKRHVYARIIKDFYMSEPEEQRPKIFGMTASPVDARVDVVQAALELEELLHSKITTTSDLMLLQSSVSRPKEDIATYTKLRAPFETQLYLKLYRRYSEIEAFGKIFAFSKQCTSELGPWCADQVWRFALSEQEYRKLERKEERNMSRQTNQEGLDLIEKDIELLRGARKVVEDHIFDVPDPETNDLSSKVVLLHRFLKHVYAEETSNKCIIFVNRRYTARVLGALLAEIGSPHMKLGTLIGARAGGAGDENITFRQQMITVSQFRRGKLNCLIATSVAEEGLDIPDCSLIIRFDLYTTMIQYIQSRGRARHSISRYIHMLEVGNVGHRKVLGDVRSAEGIMREFCQSLPADRLLNWEPSNSSDLLLDEENERIYIEPGSGAKLTFTSAMQIVGHYVGSLPHDGEDVSPPLYKIRSLGAKAYICELLLPAGSPITCVEGVVMTTKAGAKRAAAFEACLQLRAKEYLDVHLLPKYRLKDIPKMANAHLALDSNKTNTYASKEKPGFWTIKDSTPPAQVWVTIFVLTNQQEINRRLQPMAIITREKFPRIPAFPIYSDRGGVSDVISLRLNKPLAPTDENLHKLNMFTIRLFYDLFNKLFELDYATIPYWIAPCKNGEWSEETLAGDVLDWEMMAYIMSALEFEWDKDTPIEGFVDRFLVDRRQRSRRFIVHDCDPMLSPKDLVPTQGAQAPGIENILDYSYNAGKKGAVKWKWVKWEIPETEPVLIADRLLHRLNYLDPPSEKDANTTTDAYICPSAFQVSMIPCHVIHMAMIFPSISTRIDAYLHAWDVCNLLGIQDLDLGLALEAITKDSDNSHEHGQEQVNVRKGMGKNYERLEFLGDCFLKLATSISLFSQNHEDDEFQLHVQRMLLICNQHLFEKAKQINLPAYIQTEGFSRRWWYPAMKQILGKGTGKEIVKADASHRLADKSISDVCEALIGAAIIGKGLDGATEMVTAILQTPDHQQKEWADYYKGYTKPAYQLALPSASQIKLAADIEKQIGYKFKSPRLLVSAFTHSSNPYSWEKVPCYQRLEFLGDALLDLVCVRYIFSKYPEADPQWLTEHKMAMVSNKFLGAISVLMGFHRKLKRVGQHLDIAIRDYETEILEAREKSNSAVDFWTSINPPPKALPDILEAFIGAIFVDSEFNYEVVEKFVADYILPFFVDMTIYDNFAGQHPTTFLTKRMTDLGCSNWGYESEQFRTEEEHYILTGILIHSKVFAFGRGQSAKTARVSASEAALKKLNGNGLTEFHGICDCKIFGEKAMKDEEIKDSGVKCDEDDVIWLEE